MNIEINVGNVDLNSEIGEHRIYDDEYEEYRSEPYTIGDAVAKQVFDDLKKTEYYGGLRKQAEAIRQEEIRAAVRDQIADALTKPIQKTNQWGEAQGSTTTMREIIVAEVGKFFTEVKGGSYSNRARLTEAQTVVQNIVKAELTKEIAETIAAEKQKVVAVVQGKAAELLADAVKQGLK